MIPFIYESGVLSVAQFELFFEKRESVFSLVCASALSPFFFSKFSSSAVYVSRIPPFNLFAGYTNLLKPIRETVQLLFFF